MVSVLLYLCIFVNCFTICLGVVVIRMMSVKILLAVFIDGYCGLSESGLCVFGKLCKMCACVWAVGVCVFLGGLV